MSRHYAVVRIDQDALDRLAAFRPVSEAEKADYWCCYIECSDPTTCSGWVECREDHAGYDNEDARDEGEAEIHGVTHTYHGAYGWTVEYPGCVVKFACEDTPEGVALDGPHRYLLDVDWDEDECYLTVVREETGDE